MTRLSTKRKLLLTVVAALSLCGCGDDNASSSLVFVENVSKVYDLPVVDIDSFFPHPAFEISLIYDDPETFGSAMYSVIGSDHRWDAFSEDIAEIVDYLEESGDIAFIVSNYYAGGITDKGFMFLDDALISYIVYGCATLSYSVAELVVVTVPSNWVSDPLRLHVERIATTVCAEAIS